MTKSQLEKISILANEAAVYIPGELDGERNCEAIRVRAADDANDCMYGTGEESGLEYTVYYEDVNLELDMFYKFQLMENTG